MQHQDTGWLTAPQVCSLNATCLQDTVPIVQLIMAIASGTDDNPAVQRLVPRHTPSSLSPAPLRPTSPSGGYARPRIYRPGAKTERLTSQLPSGPIA